MATIENHLLRVGLSKPEAPTHEDPPAINRVKCGKSKGKGKAKGKSESKGYTGQGKGQSTYQTKKTNIKQLDWFKPLLRVASVLIITFGIYFTMFYNTLTEVQTFVSQQTTIELPDQSKVTLNADSRIEYNASDWNDNRRLNLDGEARLKV